MKIGFYVGCYSWHIEHYIPLINEFSRRGHQVVLVDNESNYDFVFIADEESSQMRNSVFLGHSFDAKGAFWTNENRMKMVNKCLFVCVYSNYYKNYLEKFVKVPIYVTGMPKLDGLWGKGNNIYYAPTFDAHLNSRGIVEMEGLGHPA